MAPEVTEDYSPDLTPIPPLNTVMMNQYDLVQFDRPRFAMVSATPEGTESRNLSYLINFIDKKTNNNGNNGNNNGNNSNNIGNASSEYMSFTQSSWSTTSTSEIPKLYQLASELLEHSIKTGEDEEVATTAISNLTEMHLGKVQLVRAAAYKLEECGRYEEASHLYRRVLQARGEEPQSYRDLALVLAKLKKWDEVIQLYNQILTRYKPDWDARFSQIEVVAMMDLCGIIPFMNKLEVSSGLKIPYSIVPVASDPLQVDLRAVLTWDVDGLDLELQALEPKGDVLNSFSNQGSLGSLLSRDFAGGYGPVEFVTKIAFEGRYAFRARVRSPCAKPILGGEVTLRFTIYTDFGNPEKQKSQTRVWRVGNLTRGQNINLGSILVSDRK